MNRRDFLRNSGWFVVGATLVGCGDNGKPETNVEPAGTFSFPQGLASGDPRASSVVLWTRVVLSDPGGDASAAIPLRVHVSTDPAFTTLIVDLSLMAAEDNDHTVRILVTGLSP